MHKIFSAAAAAVLLGISGCMSFEYIGQSFPETPQAAPVTIFHSRRELPPGKYGVIGRGVLTAPARCDRYDIDERLTEEADKCGADAVCIVKTEKIQAGTFRVQNDPFINPSPSSVNPANLNPDGSPIQIDSYGSETSIGQVQHRVELMIKVLMLKDKAELDRIIAERDKVSKRERRSVDLPPQPSSPRVIEVRETGTTQSLDL